MNNISAEPFSEAERYFTEREIDPFPVLTISLATTMTKKKFPCSCRVLAFTNVPIDAQISFNDSDADLKDIQSGMVFKGPITNMYITTTSTSTDTIRAIYSMDAEAVAVKSSQNVVLTTEAGVAYDSRNIIYENVVLASSEAVILNGASYDTGYLDVSDCISVTVMGYMDVNGQFQSRSGIDGTTNITYLPETYTGLDTYTKEWTMPMKYLQIKVLNNSGTDSSVQKFAVIGRKIKQN